MRMTPDQLCVGVLSNGLVVVSPSDGKVWSVRCSHKELGKTTSKRGYSVCTLHLDGQRKQIKIHRLIWISVNGVPPLGSFPDHINRVKTDNRIENLRLVDAKGNARNRRSYKGSGNPAAKITEGDVKKMRKRHLETGSYLLTAREFGVSKSLVARVVRRELWN